MRTNDIHVETGDGTKKIYATLTFIRYYIHP